MQNDLLNEQRLTTCNKCGCDIALHYVGPGSTVLAEGPVYKCWDRSCDISCTQIFVVRAAIRHPDGIVYSVPPPGRHHNVIKYMFDLGVHSLTAGQRNISNQGFVLSNGLYARRKPAKLIAVAAGQLLQRASRLDELFSEDVW